MKKLLTLFLALAFLLVPHFAMAWSSPGHLVIAAEAYRELSPELKAETFDVLKAHPDFAKWEKSYHPNPNLDLAAYVFIRSSAWPDDIRRSGSQYDHPNWHFIDYPLRPPAFPREPGPKPTDDILFGLAQCEKTLSDTNASPELRAAYLSWLIHLVGDIHQPLHCASLFTDAYPKGDRGGNDFYVKPAQSGVRLHGIWDGLLGSSVNPQTQWKYAITIDAEYPRMALPGMNAHRVSVWRGANCLGWAFCVAVGGGSDCTSPRVGRQTRLADGWRFGPMKDVLPPHARRRSASACC